MMFQRYTEYDGRDVHRYRPKAASASGRQAAPGIDRRRYLERRLECREFLHRRLVCRAVALAAAISHGFGSASLDALELPRSAKDTAYLLALTEGQPA
jgi:hypothetical protein